jgi:hypothetical protein
MLGICKDLLRKFVGAPVSQGVGIHHHEQANTYPKGEVFFEMRDAVTGVLIDKRHVKNVVTKDLSILVARLCRNPLEPNFGIKALAVGSGDIGWDLQNPPAPTNSQRAILTELARKTFSAVTYRDEDGNESPIPTHVVDFTTVYGPSEAVGPLVEMGLLGGDISGDLTVRNPLPASGPYDPTEDVVGKDLLCNYLTFPVINKPNSATLSITWRITF